MKTDGLSRGCRRVETKLAEVMGFLSFFHHQKQYRCLPWQALLSFVHALFDIRDSPVERATGTYETITLDIARMARWIALHTYPDWLLVSNIRNPTPENPSCPRQGK